MTTEAHRSPAIAQRRGRSELMQQRARAARWFLLPMILALAVVAVDPWRPMQVLAGPSAAALTRRAEISEPATVGLLTLPLAAGPRYRLTPEGRATRLTCL